MNSSSGFQTKVWGAPMWLCLHLISLNYTPEKKVGYKAFFKNLQHVLPCGACRCNYKNIIEHKVPMTDDVFVSREAFSMWVFLVHNQVQKDIHAKTESPHDVPKYNDTVLDYMKAMSFYEKYRAKCVKNSYGCVVPMKGSRRRSRIVISKYTKPRQGGAIVNES